MTLTCDKARWTVDGEGHWACFRVERGMAQAAAGQVAEGRPHTLELKAEKRRRSLDANAYCWVLLDKLAAALGRPKTELYRGYVREIGGNSETVCVVDAAVEKLRSGWGHNGLGWVTEVSPSKLPGCTNVVLYYGSSTYDTGQMARLIDLIAEDCRGQGIETLTPGALEKMKESWHA